MGLVNTCWATFCVLAGMGGIWSKHVEMHFMFFRCYGLALVNTCWYALCIFAGIGWVWSTQVDMHFHCSLTRKKYGQRLLIVFCVLADMGWVLSTHVNMHFTCSVAWQGFIQRMFRYILWPRWHGMCFEIHLCPYILRSLWFRMGLVNKCWDSFCVIVGIWGVCSTHVEMHFVSSLAWDGLGQCMHGIEVFCSSHFEVHFVCSLAWVGFSEHKSICILCACWHGLSLCNTCWDEILLSLKCEGLGQHELRYILCPV